MESEKRKLSLLAYKIFVYIELKRLLINYNNSYVNLKISLDTS